MSTGQGVEISGSAESQSAEPSCSGDMLSTGTTKNAEQTVLRLSLDSATNLRIEFSPCTYRGLAVCVDRDCKDTLRGPHIHNPEKLWIPPSTPGHVYFGLASDGLVKIGYSANPDSRLALLGLSKIRTVECADAKMVERALHIYFDDRRVRSEMFDIDLAAVESVCEKLGVGAVGVDVFEKLAIDPQSPRHRCILKGGETRPETVEFVPLRAMGLSIEWAELNQ